MILMYHRVSPEVALDPWSLNVTPQNFAEQLEIIRRNYLPMSLQSLNRQVQQGRRTPRRIALTFDDGYADNLLYAWPILERSEIPATVFVVSEGIGLEREFWWDELELLLLLPGKLPGSLSIQVNENTYRWDLGDSADYTQADYDRFHPWQVSWAAAPTPRQHIHQALYNLLRPLLPGERRKLLDQLWELVGRKPAYRRSNRALNPEELVRLGESRLVEVGAHTASHPLLSSLPAGMQRDEIERGKAQLEALTGFPVTSFSYPYGDYNSTTLDIVKEAGFNCACTTIADAIWSKVPPLLLPRLEIKNWDGEEFSRRLRRWSWD
jgi:peptidoglycan/xylan/chitin deacetylase (PgdA/CDA1 family)